jgi:hypothetical protein
MIRQSLSWHKRHKILRAFFNKCMMPKLGKVHWKIMFISGMGFFTKWHPTPVDVGLVTSTALLAAVGAPFGRVADMLGRKHI